MPSSLAHKPLTLSLFLHLANVLDLIVVPLVAAEEARGALVGPGTLKKGQRGRVGNAEKNGSSAVTLSVSPRTPHFDLTPHRAKCNIRKAINITSAHDNTRVPPLRARNRTAFWRSWRAAIPPDAVITSSRAHKTTAFILKTLLSEYLFGMNK